MNPRILDLHNDTILRVVDQSVDLCERHERGHVDLPRLREGGIGCAVFACYASRLEHGDGAAARADALLDAAENLCRQPGFTAPKSSADLDALRDSDAEVGVLLAVEGGGALGGDLKRLELFRRRGVRYLTLAWGDNALTGSAFGDGGGLTALGRDAVRLMDDLGILVDVSHMSDSALADTLETARGVVIASHSDCRALCQSPRNLRDDQIRAIAARGGVIGVNFAPGFLSEQTRVAAAPLMARVMEAASDHARGFLGAMEELRPELDRVPRPDMDAVVDHLERLVEVGGIECAAFGTDFDGIQSTPTDLPDCAALPALIARLQRRGFTDADLQLICWDNWSRVLTTTFGR